MYVRHYHKMKIYHHVVFIRHFIDCDRGGMFKAVTDVIFVAINTMTNLFDKNTHIYIDSHSDDAV